MARCRVSLRCERRLTAQGLEANYLRRGPSMFSDQFHWLIGLRYWELEEDLTVAATSQTGAFGVSTFDNFATRNRFFGGQVGGKLNFGYNRFTVDLVAKLAVGAMLQDVSIDGGSRALPAVRHDRRSPRRFPCIVVQYGRILTHEVGVHARYDPVPRLSRYRQHHVVRSAATSSTSIKSCGRASRPTWASIRICCHSVAAQASNPVGGPAFRFNTETFWMYGINLGVSVQF